MNLPTFKWPAHAIVFGALALSLPVAFGLEALGMPASETGHVAVPLAAVLIIAGDVCYRRRKQMSLIDL